MTDYIVNALTGADLGAYFVTLIVSMIPVIELRGAIPLGVGLGLSHFDAMWVSMLGNMLPVTLGNILGGLFVGFTMWFGFLRKTK